MNLTCDAIRKQLDLFLYGELDFAGEERVQQHLEACESCQETLAKVQLMHQSLDRFAVEVPDGLLVSARRGLRDRLELAAVASREGFADRLRAWWSTSTWLRPVGAFAMAALAFFAGRVTTVPARTTLAEVQPAALAATRVRYVEPAENGVIQIALDETRQRVVSGSLENPEIKQLLLAAAKDPSDPGLRVESVEMLCSRSQEAEIRDALVWALEHDTNTGVRLKALEGLKPYIQDPPTRQALTRVLLKDSNPGVRAQAIDLLTQVRNKDMVAPLQELLRKEDNDYVRLRTQRVLSEMNASPGIF
jgi:hypothetical protein